MSSRRFEQIIKLARLREGRALADWSVVSARLRKAQGDLETLAQRLEDPMPAVFERSEEARSTYFHWRGQLHLAHAEQSEKVAQESARLKLWRRKAEEAVLSQNALRLAFEKKRHEERTKGAHMRAEEFLEAEVTRRAFSWKR